MNNRSKKIFYTIIGVLIFGLIFKYIDLLLIEKYETQLEGLNATDQQIKDSLLLAQKVKFQKIIVLLFVILSFISIFVISKIKVGKR